MTKALHGKVIGKTIELDDDPGIPDGQEVNVVVTVARPTHNWGEGIKRSAGAATKVPDFDGVFEQVESDRQTAAFRDSNA